MEPGRNQAKSDSKRIAVIGYGVEGQSAARYYLEKGYEVSVLDQQSDAVIPPQYNKVLGEGYLDGLDDFDLVLRSPIMHPQKLAAKIKQNAVVTSSIIEFFDHCPAQIIGVTGTKGKSTTSSLIAHILEGAGKKTWLAGNIGIPVLDILGDIKSSDQVVLELSSFQLQDLKKSPHIGVMLHIGIDHLDYHQDVTEYTEAKTPLWRYQNSDDIAVYRADDSLLERLLKLSPAQTKIPYSSAHALSTGAYIDDDTIYYNGTKICAVADVALLGKHNLENVCAAVAATFDIVRDSETLKKAIRSFKSLPHRLQPIAEIDGVRYIDDSISTNPDTAIAALKTFSEPKVMILGGSDKGLDFKDLAAEIAQNNVKYALIIGSTAADIGEKLKEAGFTNFQIGPDKMDELVEIASKHAESGDIVLLSPGCASFGLFRNYKDRGEQFCSAVTKLKTKT